jgi:hypothetical protein
MEAAFSKSQLSRSAKLKAHLDMLLATFDGTVKIYGKNFSGL